ncbi:hypothetical protein TSTA_076430 [Paecilomyces variotii No. 5]|uniref:Uncharacterized protein n=1 Tax=Byssochlamys spectabilis (strain No. 5 / NBRC 109023) TaxID=1356009 RepID=V5GEK8_BYSSN|nr:hypothetical protein TSTA_076430 [Paecilomyces variotii No. 5]
METDLSTCNPTDIFNSFDSDLLFPLSDEDFIYPLEGDSNESSEHTAEESPDRVVEETRPSEVASDEQPNDCQNADDLYTSDFFDSAFWSVDGIYIPESFPEIIPAPSQRTTPEENKTMDGQIFNSESRPFLNGAQDSADTFVEPPIAAEDQPADPEEPPRKRTRHRRKQIVPAGISYNELASSVATTEPTPLPVPQQAPILDNTVQTAVHSVPSGPFFNPDFGIGQLALALQNFGQTLMSYHNMGPNNSIPPPVIPMPPALPTPCASELANFIPISTFPTQTSTASIPVSRAPPVPNQPNITTSSQPAAPSRPRPVQQFTFAETSVPESFVANPNNHGRWQIDASGRRHYLNGPKNKRPH